MKPSRAELLIELGRWVLRPSGQSKDWNRLAEECAILPQLLRLSVDFAEAPELLQLRAMVEEWSLERIHEALRENPTSTSFQDMPATLCHG